ncbi:trichothecene 3-O-acetyltransferase [Rhizodiscina lignyota]|uniref:Trichothecene 3-O-acetyltransferase n=1 Tax=Rhizodiscina lignyota TaxID=1504668 RepID=A0A9P4IKG9_9PEZI|nr:trichothecene 3-O-acetyltransferase [Rhizodiscina lignyota]
MSGSASLDDLDVQLSTLEQHLLPVPIYTQICLCFALTDTSSHSVIINTLTKGLERLSASFPWVAGQIVTDAVDGGSTETKIKSFEKTPPLIVRDFSNDASIPTMDALRRAKFPMRMLDEGYVAPRKTLPDGSKETSRPVFLVQATFIAGALLLTFLAAHETMDGVAQGHVIHLFSKACCNEAFTNEELSTGNLPRHNIIPLLNDPYQPGPELGPPSRKPNPSHSSPNEATDLPKCSWVDFAFREDSLIALKSLAMETVPRSSGYISTDDALTALIWQSVTRARLPRLDPAAETIFARAVNVRRYLNIPETFPGLVQNMTYHIYPTQKLVEESLGAIASQFRSAVDPKTSQLAYNTRSLATFLSRPSKDKNRTFLSDMDYSTDIALSSWVKLDCYELEFGLDLGQPEAVRRPQFVPVEGLMYMLPKRQDSEVAMAVCLRDEDIERLRADEEFAKYGTYIK